MRVLTGYQSVMGPPDSWTTSVPGARLAEWLLGRGASTDETYVALAQSGLVDDEVHHAVGQALDRIRLRRHASNSRRDIASGARQSERTAPREAARRPSTACEQSVGPA